MGQPGHAMGRGPEVRPWQRPIVVIGALPSEQFPGILAVNATIAGETTMEGRAI